MIYLVTNGEGSLVHICESEQYALNYIALYGDESFSIDVEEMC